jgi:hypothetical protein
LQFIMEYNMTMLKSYVESEVEKLESKYLALRIQKQKLDMFFDVYLEKYDRFMRADDTENKYWKLYRSKLKEYEKVETEITSNRYFRRKFST